MFTEIVNFTPMTALAGGAMIGLAALVLLFGIGRIAGISGALHNLFEGGFGWSWRASFLVGLIVGAGLYVLMWPGDLPVRQNFPIALLILSGLLVGAGTRLGSGCTSGHGICGIGRLSPRSMVATAVFMTTGALAAIFFRHVLGVTA